MTFRGTEHRNRILRAALVAFAIFCSVAAISTLSTVDAYASGENHPKGKRLSANKYYKFRPFTLPVLYKGEIQEQFTIVIAFELANEDARVLVQSNVPRIRDEVYKVLFKMVTFRRRGAPMPDINLFKTRLLRVAHKTVGKHNVPNMLIQQAFKRPVR